MERARRWPSRRRGRRRALGYRSIQTGVDGHACDEAGLVVVADGDADTCTGEEQDGQTEQTQE
jgi:hypothetical protein